MRVIRISAGLMLLIFFIFPAFSQTNELDVDKMRADALKTAKNGEALYRIVDVTRKENSFEIYYDIDSSPDTDYDVSLMVVRDSDPMFRLVPKHVSGNIGTGSFYGKNNLIVWEYKKDSAEGIKGNDYRFDLTIRKIERSSFPWLWTGLGVAAAGGTAAILLLGGKSSGGPLDHPPVNAIPAIGISRPN